MPLYLSSRRILLYDSLAEDPRWLDQRNWLVELPDGFRFPVPPGVPHDISPDLGPRLTASTRAGWGGDSGPAKIGTLVFGALALILTVLVTSAAFSVSIRRRQARAGHAGRDRRIQAAACGDGGR